MPDKSGTDQPGSDEATRLAGGELSERLSVSAVLFQAQTLLDALETFSHSDYPTQALIIAHILKLLARRAFTELSKLDRVVSLSKSDEPRVRALCRIVHALNAYIRYLQASDPLRTPPGVQQAISLLISTHGTDALKCAPEKINVLVRPQWTYNLKYLDIIDQFGKDADCVLSVAFDLDAYETRDIIEVLWKEAYSCEVKEQRIPQIPEKMPEHIAVLSFAGLDRDDVLLYPLLAHELGHFLDFASESKGGPFTVSKTEQYFPTMKALRDANLRPEQYSSLVEKIAICLREITADLLATRMAGVGYLFAFNEFFKTFGPWPGARVNPRSGYPGFGLRLKLIFNELDSAEAGIESVRAIEAVLAKWSLSGGAILQGYMDRIRAMSGSLETVEPRARTPEAKLIEKTVTSAISAVQELVRGIIPVGKAARVPSDVEDMVDLLKQRIPPFQPSIRSQRQARGFDPWSFQEVLTAGWLYQMAIGEECERLLPPERRFKEYQDTCMLVLKALELEGARKAINSIAEENGERETTSKPECRITAGAGRGVVSGPSIREALDRKDAVERLVLCPDLGDGPIESASRDLHLGHWFRISRRTSLENIDIAYKVHRDKAKRRGQSEVFVQSGERFVLQPGDFALAASLEYVYLPSDMMAFVEGKSSLGRAGLLIATATQVAPGFKGCIVLELFNAGTVPIILRPAMGVAQLVLVSTDMKVPEDWLYSGGFRVQIKP